MRPARPSAVKTEAAVVAVVARATAAGAAAVTVTVVTEAAAAVVAAATGASATGVVKLFNVTTQPHVISRPRVEKSPERNM